MKLLASARSWVCTVWGLAAVYLVVVGSGYVLLRSGRGLESKQRADAETSLHDAAVRTAAQWRYRSQQMVDVANQMPLDATQWPAWMTEVQMRNGYAGMALFDGEGRVLESLSAARDPSPAVRALARDVAAHGRRPVLDRIERRESGDAEVAHWLDMLVPTRSSGALWVRLSADAEFKPLMHEEERRVECGARTLWYLDDAGRMQALDARSVPAFEPREATDRSAAMADQRAAAIASVPISGTSWWVQTSPPTARCTIATFGLDDTVFSVFGWASAGLALSTFVAYRMGRARALSRREVAHADELPRQLQWLVDTSFDAVLVLDGQLRVVAADKQAAALFNLPQAAVAGCTLASLMPQLGQGAARWIQELADSGLAQPCDLEQSGDTSVPLSVCARRLDVDARSYVVLVLRDVRAERDAEAALRASEARFRVLSESLPVGVFRIDLNGNRIYTNARLNEMAGWPVPDRGWASRRDLFHPADRERAARELDAAYAQRRGTRVEMRLLWPDGSVRWVVAQTEPERAPDGEVTGFVGSVTDVTSLRTMREEVELRARMLQIVFDSPFVCSLVIDASSGQIEMANQTMCDLLGYTREELLQHNWVDLVEDPHTVRTSTQRRAMMRGEIEGYRSQRVYRRRNGDLVPAEMEIRCLRRADGWIERVIAVARPT